MLLCKKVAKKFGGYLCTRKRQKVPWMSGLVNGLQNRLRRFESARHLRNLQEKTRCSAVGSVPGLGPGCRRFESCHLDQIESR